MYGLKKMPDISFMIGKELLQISLGSHQAILNFDGDVSISTECDLQLGNGNKKPIQISSENPSQTKELVSLLGTKIKKITKQNDKELSLYFSNDFFLSLIDSNAQYESFEIKSPGQSIIV